MSTSHGQQVVSFSQAARWRDGGTGSDGENGRRAMGGAEATDGVPFLGLRAKLDGYRSFFFSPYLWNQLEKGSKKQIQEKGGVF